MAIRSSYQFRNIDFVRFSFVQQPYDQLIFIRDKKGSIKRDDCSKYFRERLNDKLLNDIRLQNVIEYTSIKRKLHFRLNSKLTIPDHVTMTLWYIYIYIV